MTAAEVPLREAAPAAARGALRLLVADPFLRVALVLLALAAFQAPLLELFESAEQSDLARWNEILWLVLVISAQAGARASGHVEERRHALLLAAAFGSWLAAHGLYFAAGGWADPRVSAAGDLLYTLYYLAMATVALGRPHLHSGWSARDPSYRFGLATAVLVLAFFYGYLVLVPWLAGSSETSPMVISYLLFVTLDALLLARFLQLALTTRDGRWRQLYRMLTLAFSGWMVVDVLELLRNLSPPVNTPETLTLALLSLSFAIVVWESRLRVASAGREAPAEGAPALSAWNEIAPMLAIVFVLPAIHFTMQGTGLLVEALRPVREGLLIGIVFLLGLVSSVYLYRLERRGRKLSAELAEVGAELERARRMEAVGRLAGRAAHGFNNLLTVIRGNAEMVEQRLAEQGLPTIELAEIEAATRQAAALAAELQAVSRGRVLRRDSIDLEPLLRALAARVPPRVQVELEVAPGLEPVEVDASELERSLWTLIENAVEAMGANGVLGLRAAPEEEGGEAGEEGAAPPRRRVRLEVSDTGPGIEPELLDTIFEPFVSTKGSVASSGFGLARVYGTVRQCGGEISVESRPGRGTTFRLLLLLAEPEGP